jgi:hypothetical protein
MDGERDAGLRLAAFAASIVVGRDDLMVGTGKADREEGERVDNKDVMYVSKVRTQSEAQHAAHVTHHTPPLHSHLPVVVPPAGSFSCLLSPRLSSQ